MTSYGLESFIADCELAVAAHTQAADRVLAVTPLMERLLESERSFLKPEHLASSPEHYARNAIYIAPDEQMSLFVLVWLPGQWTPVHDHGSWGVVGILQGALEERSYMSVDGQIRRDDGIELKRGGVTLLKENSVASFVPNPDHIHMTGVPTSRKMAASLHLYGRNMDSFHIYDVAQGTRRLIDVSHEKT